MSYVAGWRPSLLALVGHARSRSYLRGDLHPLRAVSTLAAERDPDGYQVAPPAQMVIHESDDLGASYRRYVPIIAGVADSQVLTERDLYLTV